ncbi:MAG TPA: alkaline phosphatase D family protein [Chitinophagales bacterium]|nr:alkaline phosphatase D family protein [Chitinophagales bacterium]
MKKILTLLLAAISAITFAQDPMLAPFYHGVASGDALADRVVIWTRVSDATGTLSVDWKMATDTLLSDVVQSGTAATDSSRDYTVKVDVSGLQPDTWYYYQFTYNGQKSLIGRTRTLPAGDNQRIRVAVVSCAAYGSGIYYNAYLSIARRNDIHAVLHLGDYIYEYAEGGFSGMGVQVLPDHETITLDDYRQRHSSYKLDPYLRRLHQQYPFYTVWDDHETANNSWTGGAENHTPGTEGDWQVRKSEGERVYFEWMPIREQAPGDYTIYRKLSFGNLADFIMLDTRLEGRDKQVSLGDQAGMQDTTRTILGAAQMQWFKTQLSSSQATWKVVGQQVMIAPLVLPLVGVVNTDQWDGYQADRNRVTNYVVSNNIENVVFLTGDIHTAWANDVPQAGVAYNPGTGAGSAFVEYVVTSITSQSFPFPVSVSLIQSASPHIKYADLTQKGYFILDLDTQRAQADWVFVSTISDQNFTESYAASWLVNRGERFLRAAPGPVTDYTNTAPFAPLSVDTMNVSVSEYQRQLQCTVYPNPFDARLNVRFYRQSGLPVTVRMYNLVGKLIFEKQAGAEVSHIMLNTQALTAGSYLLTVENGRERIRNTVVKVQ